MRQIIFKVSLSPWLNYKDSSAIGSVYFTDKNDSNYVYLIGMDGPNADSLSSFGDIAKTWSSKKP